MNAGAMIYRAHKHLHNHNDGNKASEIIKEFKSDPFVFYNCYSIDAIHCPANTIIATPIIMMVPPSMVPKFGRSPKKSTAPMIDETGNRSRKGIA